MGEHNKKTVSKKHTTGRPKANVESEPNILTDPGVVFDPKLDVSICHDCYFFHKQEEHNVKMNDGSNYSVQSEMLMCTAGRNDTYLSPLSNGKFPDVIECSKYIDGAEQREADRVEAKKHIMFRISEVFTDLRVPTAVELQEMRANVIKALDKSKYAEDLVDILNDTIEKLESSFNGRDLDGMPFGVIMKHYNHVKDRLRNEQQQTDILQ